MYEFLASALLKKHYYTVQLDILKDEIFIDS